MSEAWTGFLVWLVVMSVQHSLYESACIYTACSKWGYKSCNNFCHHLGSVLCSSLQPYSRSHAILYLINKECMLIVLTEVASRVYHDICLYTRQRPLISPFLLATQTRGASLDAKAVGKQTPSFACFISQQVTLWWASLPIQILRQDVCWSPSRKIVPSIYKTQHSLNSHYLRSWGTQNKVKEGVMSKQ